MSSSGKTKPVSFCLERFFVPTWCLKHIALLQAVVRQRLLEASRGRASVWVPKERALGGKVLKSDQSTTMPVVGPLYKTLLEANISFWWPFNVYEGNKELCWLLGCVGFFSVSLEMKQARPCCFVNVFLLKSMLQMSYKADFLNTFLKEQRF